MLCGRIWLQLFHCTRHKGITCGFDGPKLPIRNPYNSIWSSIAQLQWHNMSCFVQKETTKDIIVKVTASNYFLVSNYSLHIVFACSSTVRTVGHLQSGQNCIIRTSLFETSTKVSSAIPNFAELRTSISTLIDTKVKNQKKMMLLKMHIPPVTLAGKKCQAWHPPHTWPSMLYHASLDVLVQLPQRLIGSFS